MNRAPCTAVLKCSASQWRRVLSAFATAQFANQVAGVDAYRASLCA
jgi:hypothetical protein